MAVLLLENVVYDRDRLLDDCPTPFGSAESDPSTDVFSLEPYAKMFSIGREIPTAPLFCTPEISKMGTEIGWFRALGVPVDVCTKKPSILARLMSESACWSMVIIDCEPFGGIGSVIEQLKNEIRRDLVVPFVLVSSHCGSAVYWVAHSPTVTTLLTSTFSINTMEETVFAVLGE